MLLDSTGSGRLGGAAAAGGGRDALSYGVSFATTRSHQLARGAPALTPLVTLTRARARPWSARCYGVARQRDRSRQNSTGVSGVLLSGISGSRVVPKNLARRSLDLLVSAPRCGSRRSGRLGGAAAA